MNVAVVLAGGIGQRMGEKIPKQFIEVNDIPIIIHTLEAFHSHSEIDAIVVVCLEEWFSKLNELIKKYNLNKVRTMVKPGATRRESSFNAIKSLDSFCRDEDIVLIHDAARPNISKKVISENIAIAKKVGACETVTPAHDTIVMSRDGAFSHEIPPREKLFIVQTPQSFKYSLIKEAHIHYMEKQDSGMTVPDITDDAGLLLYADQKVALVIGDKLNIKVTSPEDILLLKAILQFRDQ